MLLGLALPRLWVHSGGVAVAVGALGGGSKADVFVGIGPLADLLADELESRKQAR